MPKTREQIVEAVASELGNIFEAYQHQPEGIMVAAERVIELVLGEFNITLAPLLGEAS